MKIRIPLMTVALTGLALMTFVPGMGAQITSSERRDALKIIRLLDQAGADSLMNKTPPPGRSDFTESEFNAYIACLIAAEKDPILKELRLKLFDQNRIEGKIFIDLTGRKLPAVLKPQMNLYFEGVFTTKDGQIRLDFRKLYLDGQRIPNLVLDMIIYIASKLGKADAGSINDWYQLPPGIRNLETKAGMVSVYHGGGA